MPGKLAIGEGPSLSGFSGMVGIAQLVRVPGCGPGGRGFNSHYSPHFYRFRAMGCRQAVRHQTLTLALVGSNPATPASFFDPLAQLVEHLTFNQVVRSSTLRRITIFSSAESGSVCGCGGIGRRARFRFWCPKGVWVQVPSPAPNPGISAPCGSSSFGRAQPCQG